MVIVKAVKMAIASGDRPRSSCKLLPLEVSCSTTVSARGQAMEFTPRRIKEESHQLSPTTNNINKFKPQLKVEW